MTSIVLPWPPSNNTYYRRVGAKTLISERGRQYARLVTQLCAVARISKREGRLQVLITACPPDKRKRDLDNMLKGLLDALTHGGAWLDDSQIDDLRIVRGRVQAGCAVSVEIKEIAADA